MHQKHSLLQSLPRCLAAPVLAGVAVCLTILTAAAQAQVIVPDWQPSVHSNPNPGTPTGSGSADGSTLEFNITGGSAGPSNYVRLFSTTDSALEISPEGKGVKMSASGISFTTESTTAAGNQQILFFTLAPTPGEAPYKDGASGMQKAVSLSITAGGQYSLGWVTGALSEKGWVSAVNSSGHAGTLSSPITGFDLSLTATTYHLVLFTADGETELDGDHLLPGDWGAMGVSVTLQKTFSDTSTGQTNRLAAEVAHFEVAAIPEPSTALLLGGTLAGLLLTTRCFGKNR